MGQAVENELNRLHDGLPQTWDCVHIVPGMIAYNLPETWAHVGEGEMRLTRIETLTVTAVMADRAVCVTSDGLQPVIAADRLASTREAALEAQERGG